MKKAIAILILLTMTAFLFACGDSGRISTFADLKNDEVLYVGSTKRYMNYEDENTTEVTLSYIAKTKYELFRSSSNYNTNSVKYDGYYYY